VLGREDARQLERVVELVREVLGPDVLGVYLFGSAVLGGLRPESDLDLLAVSARPTTLDEKRRVVERLLSISGRRTPEGRWRRVELTVVVAPEVRPWRFPPRFDLQYGDWLRSAFERGEVEPWPTNENPDLAVLLKVVLLAGRPVLGPPPAEVLDPVPREDLVRAMVDGIDPCTRTSTRTRATSSSRSRGSGAPLRRGRSARRTPRPSGRSRGFPRSTGPSSRAPGRSTSAARRSSGTTSRAVSAPTRTTSRPRSAACAERHQVHGGSACETSSRSAILAPLPVAARRSPSHEHPQQSPACPHGRRAPDRSRLPRMRGARR
jgi:predicted nucleotidyltransferase